MTNILVPQIKAAFTRLGQYLQNYNDDELKQLVNSAKHYNAWFTPEQTEKAVRAIGTMLNPQDITIWLDRELTTGEKGKSGELEEKPLTASPKTVGLVLAGNIPLVGLHDILCVLASGNIALIKLSSQDKHLTPHLLRKLVEWEPLFARQIRFTEKLEAFDAVIATGSNNSSRYFEYYFKDVPHIIRKNRNSIAILRGDESKEDLNALGSDIFDYFGLGCRNVSKLFVPRGYEFRAFFEAIEPFNGIINHHKYNNNYDYNKSVFLVNREPHFDNGFLLLRNTTSTDTTNKGGADMSSPLATLYYEEYDSYQELEKILEDKAPEIQCIAGRTRLSLPVQQVAFGETQKPALWDYADGINTMQFLLTL